MFLALVNTFCQFTQASEHMYVCFFVRSKKLHVFLGWLANVPWDYIHICECFQGGQSFMIKFDGEYKEILTKCPGKNYQCFHVLSNFCSGDVFFSLKTL